MADAGDLARMLAGDIDGLARELLPQGRRVGREWRANIAGASSGSLSVCLTGPKRGLWIDHYSDSSGDALDLVAFVRHGGDLRAAILWAQGRFGVAVDKPSTSDRPSVPAPAAAPEPPRDDTEARARRGAAQRIFLSGQVALAGTPVAAYLAGRGIDLSELGWQPRSLRYHPSLPNRETGRNFPAMVAAVTNQTGETTAVHRTWLDSLPAGGWAKAPLQNSKMSLGTIDGGMIRLWRGASRKPLAQAQDGETIILTEGIEDGLSCALLCPELRVLCAVTLGNMARVVLPPAVREVILAADKDGDNLIAAKVLQRAIDRFVHEGRRVRVARSPEGKDFNDLLKADLK